MSIRNDLDETRREVTGFMWTRRSKLGKVGVSVLSVVVAYVVFAIAMAAVIDAPVTTEAIVETTTIETLETASPQETVDTFEFPSEAERCGEQLKAVENYNIFKATREGYLLKLHLLQRECPAVAKREGLDSTFLPKCGNDLTAENCTAYEGP